MDIISYILSRKYCDNSIVGLGAIKGANCTVDDIVHQDGINTVTFKWTGTDGTTKTRDMIVYDGTPIYVWESGNTYHYGDLAIYESQFYRCITENHDATFDDTKWNEIGSPDGNYDLVQSRVLLPARFTSADRKLYYVIDEYVFYLWNGSQWVAQNDLVQLETFPTASAKYLGKIYQYTGVSNGVYRHGFLYECINQGTELSPSYVWKCIDPSVYQGTGVDSLILNNINNNVASGNYSTAQNDNTIAQGYAQTVLGTYNVPQGTANAQLPTDSAVIIGNGDPLNRSNALSIQWDGTVVFQDGSSMKSAVQHSLMPIASVDNLGQVIHYIGATNANYHSKHFYECISDGATPPTYSWRDLGITLAFVGTQDEWDALTTAQQNQYDMLNFTDDETVIDLGVYLRKITTMPSADECPSEFVMYVGGNTANYTRGYIYRSVPSIVSGEIVYNWVRVDTQPSHPYIQSDWSQNDSTANDYIKHKPTLGTASEKNFTDNVRPNSHDLVESNAVYNAIASSIASVYKPHGDLACADLTADLLIPANVGNIYNMSDSGTTSALFMQGAGKPIVAGNTVGIVQAGEDLILYNLMGNMIDLHNYQTKELNNPITIGGVEQTEVEGALNALNNTKADKATTLDGYGITNAYTKTETDTAITNAINDLDVTDTAVAGSYVTAVSEVNGAISVTREAADSVPISASTKMLTSGGAYTEFEKKLEKITALPTASASNVGAIYLLTATQAGYLKGGIYECVSDGQPTPTYSWVLISSADMVEFTENELLAMW